MSESRRGPGKPITIPTGIDASWQPGKNYWRYQPGSNEAVVELMTPSKQTILIDSNRHAEVAPYAWSAKTPEKENSYVSANIKINSLDIVKPVSV
jgi:hypothetical protein